MRDGLVRVCHEQQFLAELMHLLGAWNMRWPGIRVTDATSKCQVHCMDLCMRKDLDCAGRQAPAPGRLN